MDQPPEDNQRKRGRGHSQRTPRPQTGGSSGNEDAGDEAAKKQKADVTFKKAGPGHKLSDVAGSSAKKTPPPPPGQSSSTQKKPAATSQQSDEKRQAAAAALARREKAKPKTESEDLLAKRQLAFVKEQARKEIEAEQKMQEMGINPVDNPQSESGANETSNFTTRGDADPTHLAVSGVFFSCPLIGPEVASKSEIEENIRQFLRAQPKEEIGMTSCLMIHSCNKGKERIQTCVNTLCKYVDNIIQNPSEPKFKRIRCNNKAYVEKVAVIEGSTEFLEAMGFRKITETSEGSQEEEIWEFVPNEDEAQYVARLTELRDSLLSTTPIKPELDRNFQVLLPAQVTQRRELPSDFYELTGEELRREQQRRTDAVEKEKTLRTKAQRERDELREQRLYRYAMLRVRFPDGFTIQGTFFSHEKVGDLYMFVQENLGVEDVEFSLKKAGGEKLSDMEQTLWEVKLPPASLLNFNLESDLPCPTDINFLKAEVLALVQNL